MKVIAISAYVSVILRDINGINSTVYNTENLRWRNLQLLHSVSKRASHLKHDIARLRVTDITQVKTTA